jgi:SAM-dependent methyltransferase
VRPVCPVCRAEKPSGFPLRIAEVALEKDGHIIEGALHCENENCLREFPIIDGIPLIVANIRQYISENVLSIYARRDLSEFLESIVGDCCGPASAYEQTRQHLSSYTWDHYGNLDLKFAAEEPRPGSMLRNLEAGCALAEPINLSGAILDAGCSVGRSSFALAERGAGLVLGVDLNFPMLRLASEILRTGQVRYPRRRVGLVYNRREFPAHFKNAENVDFWACDAAALPFPDEMFFFATSMNVLDCVYAPREFLISLGRVLKPGAKALLTVPYDWSQGATPVEAWLGGHSQRSPLAGSPEAVLRMLLTPGHHPASIVSLKLVAERANLPWQVRLHDRSVMSYQVHLVVVEKF